MPTASADVPPGGPLETVEIRGHIIDSLLLPKVLDAIMARGGSFVIREIEVGEHRDDASRAVIEIRGPTPQRLAEILAEVADHGAVSLHPVDCRLVIADIEGAFPENFYATTNQRTFVRLEGDWVEVDDQEMDCGIVVDAGTRRARCVAMTSIRVGDAVVVGHGGVRVEPQQRAESRGGFEFMSSPVSTEKPKGVAIRDVARELFEVRQAGGLTLLVGGPAIVHTGSDGHLCELIRRGYVQRLFAGNALATHDIEQAFFGTSLGVHLERGDAAEAGHEHHLRAINRIRRVGSIRQAVEQGLLESGIMYECVRNGVEFTLAGSIRDDGPLPDVITDTLEAQSRMRQQVRGVSFCLMIATTLHSIATGNLLPAWVKVVCVDINPSTVIKLSDRGSFQTVGLVTDVQPFLRAVIEEIDSLEAAADGQGGR